MAIVPHWYKVHHGTGVAVRALLNGVLFYRHTGSENWTVSAPANALFVPGENVLRIEILPTLVPAHSPGIRGPVEAKVMLDDDTNAAVAMCRWEWSNPNREPPLPDAGFSAFRPGGDIAEPPWAGAPQERFGPEGTPELRETVGRIHEAFARRDVGTYMDAHQLKIDTWQRAFPDNPAYRPAHLRARLAEMLQQEWIVPPYDPEALVFECQADGRVAYVRRLNDGKAIEAMARHQDPAAMQLGFATDLWLTRKDGAWQVFR